MYIYIHMCSSRALGSTRREDAKVSGRFMEVSYSGEWEESLMCDDTEGEGFETQDVPEGEEEDLLEEEEEEEEVEEEEEEVEEEVVEEGDADAVAASTATTTTTAASTHAAAASSASVSVSAASVSANANAAAAVGSSFEAQSALAGDETQETQEYAEDEIPEGGDDAEAIFLQASRTLAYTRYCLVSGPLCTNHCYSLRTHPLFRQPTPPRNRSHYCAI